MTHDLTCAVCEFTTAAETLDEFFDTQEAHIDARNERHVLEFDTTG